MSVCHSVTEAAGMPARVNNVNRHGVKTDGTVQTHTAAAVERRGNHSLEQTEAPHPRHRHAHHHHLHHQERVQVPVMERV